MQKLFTSIRDALLMPLEGNINRFSSGIFDAKGCFIEGSMLKRNSFIAAPSQAIDKLSGTYAFGGYLFRHYGHCILESLSRVYAIQTLPPNIPLLFMSTKSDVDAKTYNIFKILKIENKIKIITVPTEVKTLLFSQEGSCITPEYSNITDLQLAALAKYTPKPPTEIRHIWLSRSYLPLLGGVNNESEIESMLQTIGFEIVHPQLLSILEQLEIISRAKIVAGFSGSAFFTTLLSKHIYGKFHIFSRSGGIAPPILYFLEAKGINLKKHYPKLRQVSGSGNTKRTFSENPQEIVTALLRALLKT